MAAPVLPNDASYMNTDDEHLEIFHLIWLDANLLETRQTEQKLRSIINHLKKFRDLKECQQYIEQSKQEDRLVLIVSGEMGREMVPSIHKFRQVISIYVYCINKKKNEEWTCEYKKVNGVFVASDELISQIERDHKIQKKVEEPLPIHFFTTTDGGGESMIKDHGKFAFSQVLIDCLLRLKSTKTDEDELIDFCKDKYKENSDELNHISEFKENYSCDKVLWWYTKESFFYKTLNAALRTQNIHVIFLFRAYIYDISLQLQKHKSEEPLRVYRSQMMSKDERISLQKSRGQLISINSFFSTSTNYGKALSFLQMSDGSKNLQRILFQIDANPTIVVTKSFADIRQYSDHPDEAEVLFMLGSVFRLHSIDHNNDNVWIIKMSLCSDEEYDLKEVLTHMKQQNGSGETNLRTLGKVLQKMGKFDLAEKYFKRFLEKLPSNDPLVGSLYDDLAELASTCGHLDMSIKWHGKLLEFKNNYPIRRIVPELRLRPETRWVVDGKTVAENNVSDQNLPRLNLPSYVHVDNDETVYVSDFKNHRIIKFKRGDELGEVVAGGNGAGDKLDQLNMPLGLFVDREKDCIYICDHGNERVTCWPLQGGTNGKVIINDIRCIGLAMDNQRCLYISNVGNHSIEKYNIETGQRTVMVGNNGEGSASNQLNYPTHLFVTNDQTVYVSDLKNRRVMKWAKDVTEGISIADDKSTGTGSREFTPTGILVDQLNTVYVADCWNHQIIRYPQNTKQGTVILGGRGEGNHSNQLRQPDGLSFDTHGSLYVADSGNNRVQKFDINPNPPSIRSSVCSLS